MLQKMKKSALSCGLAVVALITFCGSAFGDPILTLSNSKDPAASNSNIGEIKSDAASVYYLKDFLRGDLPRQAVYLPLSLSGSGFTDTGTITSMDVTVNVGSADIVSCSPIAIKDGNWTCSDLAVFALPTASWDTMEISITAEDDNTPPVAATASLRLTFVPVEMQFSAASDKDMQFVKGESCLTPKKVSVETSGDLACAFSNLWLYRKTVKSGLYAPIASGEDPWKTDPDGLSGLVTSIGSKDIGLSAPIAPVTLKEPSTFLVSAKGPLVISDDNNAHVAGSENIANIGTFLASIIESEDVGTKVRLNPNSVSGYVGFPMDTTIEVIPPTSGDLKVTLVTVKASEQNGLTLTPYSGKEATKLLLTGTPKAEASSSFDLDVTLSDSTVQSVSLPVTISTPVSAKLVSESSPDWTGTVNGRSFTMKTNLLSLASAQNALDALRADGENRVTFATPSAVFSSSVNVSEGDNKTVTISGTIADGHDPSEVVLKSLTLTLNGTVYTQDNINLALVDTERHDGGDDDDSSSGCNAAGAGLLFSVLPLLIFTRRRA